MPIVVSYENPMMAANLAGQVGDARSQQVNNASGLQNAQFNQQVRQQGIQNNFQQQQMRQQASLAQQQFAHQDYAQQQLFDQQQQLQQNSLDSRNDQSQAKIDAQIDLAAQRFGYQDTRDALTRGSREHIAELTRQANALRTGQTLDNQYNIANLRANSQEGIADRNNTSRREIRDANSNDKYDDITFQQQQTNNRNDDNIAAASSRLHESIASRMNPIDAATYRQSVQRVDALTRRINGYVQQQRNYAGMFGTQRDQGMQLTQRLIDDTQRELDRAIAAVRDIKFAAASQGQSGDGQSEWDDIANEMDQPNQPGMNQSDNNDPAGIR